MLTISEVSTALAVSRRHVVRLIDSGKLKASDLGLGARAVYRVEQSEVDRLLDEGTVKQAKKKPKMRGIERHFR